MFVVKRRKVDMLSNVQQTFHEEQSVNYEYKP